MCSLRFKNNFLTDGRVRFASKAIFFLANVFALLRKIFSFYLMCSLCFENNFLADGRVCFASQKKFLSI
jgi:hypothetical protein